MCTYLCVTLQCEINAKQEAQRPERSGLTFCWMKQAIAFSMDNINVDEVTYRQIAACIFSKFVRPSEK